MCSSGAHRQRYTHSHKPSPTFPRYQLTTGGWGRERGREGSSLLPSPLSTVWNYKHYYLGEVLSRAEGSKPEILTKLSLPSRINKYRLKNSQLKHSRPEETGKLRKERNRTKLRKTTELQQHLGRMKRINDKKTRQLKQTKKQQKLKRLAKMAIFHKCKHTKV